MTRKELEEYQHILTEIGVLNKDIEKIEKRRSKLQTVKDKVQASEKEFPYTQIHLTVDAVDPIRNSALLKVERIKEQRLDRLEEKRIEIERYIDSIPDSQTRVALDMIYIKGENQQAVASNLHCDQSTVSRLITKHFSEK